MNMFKIKDQTHNLMALLTYLQSQIILYKRAKQLCFVNLKNLVHKKMKLKKINKFLAKNKGLNFIDLQTRIPGRKTILRVYKL